MTTHTTKVQVEPYEEQHYEQIRYKKRGDAWYINVSGEWEAFADKEASQRTIEQIIRKEYDCRY